MRERERERWTHRRTRRSSARRPTGGACRTRSLRVARVSVRLRGETEGGRERTLLCCVKRRLSRSWVDALEREVEPEPVGGLVGLGLVAHGVGVGTPHGLVGRSSAGVVVAVVEPDVAAAVGRGREAPAGGVGLAERAWGRVGSRGGGGHGWTRLNAAERVPGAVRGREAEPRGGATTTPSFDTSLLRPAQQGPGLAPRAHPASSCAHTEPALALARPVLAHLDPSHLLINSTRQHPRPRSPWSPATSSCSCLTSPRPSFELVSASST